MPCLFCQPGETPQYNCNLECLCGQYRIRNTTDINEDGSIGENYGKIECHPTCTDVFGTYGPFANITCYCSSDGC